MSFCAICYNDIKQHNIFKGGCCNIDLCVDCVKKCDKCPQCKKDYFWTKYNYSQVEELIKENAILKMNNYHLDNRVESLKEKMMDLAGEMIKKNSLIRDLKEAIFDLITKINDDMQEEENTHDLEEVIKKYNLNII